MLSSPSQQCQYVIALNKHQKNIAYKQTTQQQQVCPFCHKAYSLMKIFNYNSLKNSQYKRYFHGHSDRCTSPKSTNYCFDSNGIPGKKYCCKTCLSQEYVVVDPKKDQEKETALIMDLINSVQRKLDAVNNDIIETMNIDKSSQESLDNIRKAFQRRDTKKDIKRHAVFISN